MTDKVAPRKRPKAAEPDAVELQRFDEANVGRLGLISIHERIPSDYTKWEVKFEIDGRPARLACIAHAEFGGVPHGLDNDISNALIDLFIESGAPAGGEFQTTAYRILQRAGLDTSGRYYGVLHDSLQRLKTATYSASESWYDTRRRWVTVQFNYIEKLEYSSENDKLRLTGASVLKLRLGEPIVTSIRARYLKPLDTALLSSLERPLTRALYRLLDAKRYDPDQPSAIAVAYDANLIAWARECKILDLKPARIRRTLDGAHAELIERGYLREVSYAGRGTAQTVSYVFGDGRQKAPGHDALIEALRKHRVTRPMAENLIETYGPARVGERLEKFELMVRGGYKPANPSGLLIDVVRDESGKYADPEGFAPTDARERTAQPEKTRGEGVKGEEDVQRYELEQRAKPIEEQIDATVRTAQFVLGERLSVMEYAQLRAKLSIGLADPFELGRQISRAAMERKLETLAGQLKKFVSH